MERRRNLTHRQWHARRWTGGRENRRFRAPFHKSEALPEIADAGEPIGLPQVANSAEFAKMKSAAIPLLLLSTGTLHAELLATFQTTKGNVTAVLQYDKAPQAVANFITLAQGTRAHINPTTGAISYSLYYTGEKFFRVINDSTFKIIQTGSGTGTNSGGPGYSFRDEFHSSLTHVPYVLSMANSGKDTNGSQIFFTGSTTTHHLDNVHTVFGLIPDAASRTTIDAILAAGNDGTTITGVTISRTDPAAVAFDEFAQKLPVCSGIKGHLEVNRNVATTYVFNSPLPASSYLQGYRSADLNTWSKLGELFQGTGSPGQSSIQLDDSTLPKAFYNLTTISYPDALAPASLANRTLVMGLGNETMTYQFNATGDGGTCTYSAEPASTTAITEVDYYPAPYTATWIIQTEKYVPFRYTAKLNSTTTTHIIGTNSSEIWLTGWSTYSTGSMTLTR